MSDLLLELYSEEIPPALQEGAKSQISQNFKTFFDKNGFKDVTSEVYSTPVSYTHLTLPTNREV